MNQLKLCPFCGGEVEVRRYSVMDDKTMSEDKVIEIISEIIKIREKYEHLAEVSYPIWKQRIENDKNN